MKIAAAVAVVLFVLHLAGSSSADYVGYCSYSVNRRAQYDEAPITTVQVTGQADCCNTCFYTTGCNNWQYIDTGISKTCELHTKPEIAGVSDLPAGIVEANVGNVRPGPVPVDTCQRHFFNSTAVFPALPIATSTTAGPDPALCCNFCKQTPTCIAYNVQGINLPLLGTTALCQAYDVVEKAFERANPLASVYTQAYGRLMSTLQYYLIGTPPTPSVTSTPPSPPPTGCDEDDDDECEHDK